MIPSSSIPQDDARSVDSETDNDTEVTFLVEETQVVNSAIGNSFLTNKSPTPTEDRKENLIAPTSTAEADDTNFHMEQDIEEGEVQFILPESEGAAHASLDTDVNLDSEISDTKWDPKGVIPELPTHRVGLTLTPSMLGYDMKIMHDRPWIQNPETLPQYFNYGFDEKSWTKYIQLHSRGSQSLLEKANEQMDERSRPHLSTPSGAGCRIRTVGQQSSNRTAKRIHTSQESVSHPKYYSETRDIPKPGTKKFRPVTRGSS